MCPLGVTSWNDIKQQKLDQMWTAITKQLETYIIIAFILNLPFSALS